MDYEDLELKAKDLSKKNKLLILFPHNPVGRVWSKEELQTLEIFVFSIMPSFR